MVSMQKNAVLNLLHGYSGANVRTARFALRGMTGSGAQ